MMGDKGKLNICNVRGPAIVFALFTLTIVFPARAEPGDFLDNISVSYTHLTLPTIA